VYKKNTKKQNKQNKYELNIFERCQVAATEQEAADKSDFHRPLRITLISSLRFP